MICRGLLGPAMYTAAYYGKTEIVQDFLERHFDIELKGLNGWAPLYIAFDSPSVTAMPLEVGARTDVLSDSGMTVLDLAVKNCYSTTAKEYLKELIR